MKKIFLIPAMAILTISSGVTSNKAETPRAVSGQAVSVPVNTKIDSLNIKAAELNILIHKL